MITKNTSLDQVKRLAPPCKCKECDHGCRYGAGCFTDDQLPAAAQFLNVSVEELKEKHLETITKFNTTLWRPKHKKNKYGYGPCVFFKDNCKIHDVKPLECQTAMGCGEHGEELSIWFTLNHFLNENDPESVREYASYLKSGGKTIPGAKLEELIPDKEKLKKILDYEIIR